HGSNTNANVIFRNFIGVSISAGNLKNGHKGVELFLGASQNAILNNRIWFNNIGVAAHDANTNSNLIQGNDISFSVGAAINVNGGAANNTIGGTSAGQGNIISMNGMTGVAVNGAGSTGNAIEGNSIFGNGGGGIALSNGANNNQASPVLLFAVNNGLGDTSVV